MAVGDVINITTAATGTTFFQPAAGVEVIITWVASDSVGNLGLYDGTNAAYSIFSSVASGISNIQCKLGITNSFYLYATSSVSKGGYSGIQIK
jgi:hypothetical protein